MLAGGSFDVVCSELTFQHMPRQVQASYAAEAARVLREGGRFLAQLPRSDFYPGAEYAPTRGEAQSLLSGFRSAELAETDAYWLARAVAGPAVQGRRRGVPGRPDGRPAGLRRLAR